MDLKDYKGKFDEPIIVRDRRNGDWYWIHRRVLTEYGPKVGAGGIAIYSILASCANHIKQNCWPSIRSMAKMLDCSPYLIKEKTKVLEKYKLVKVLRRKGQKGNIYILLKLNVSTSDTFKGNVSMDDTNVSMDDPRMCQPPTQNKNKEQEYRIRREKKVKPETIDQVKRDLVEKGVIRGQTD